MSIDISKEILSSSGMFEGGAEKLVELLIIGIERINIIVEVILDPIPLIGFWFEIVVSFLDFFKLSCMFLILIHFHYGLIIIYLLYLYSCYKNNHPDYFLSYKNKNKQRIKSIKTYLCIIAIEIITNIIQSILLNHTA